MSEDRLELLARAMFAATARAIALGEVLDEQLDGLLDPEVEWIPINAALEGTRYRGRAGVHQWIAEMNRNWDVFDPRPEEFLELGNDRLLALGTWRARGQSSGVELESPAGWIFQFRNRKIVRMQTFTDRAKALEAAGLRE